MRPGSRSRAAAGIDPDRISFTVTVRVARDHAASHAIITPRSLDLARRRAIGDLLGDILPRGRDRRYERLRKRPKNDFPAMKRGQQKAAQTGHLQDRGHPEGILTCGNALNLAALPGKGTFSFRRDRARIIEPDESPRFQSWYPWGDAAQA